MIGLMYCHYLVVIDYNYSNSVVIVIFILHRLIISSAEATEFVKPKKCRLKGTP